MNNGEKRTSLSSKESQPSVDLTGASNRTESGAMDSRVIDEEMKAVEAEMSVSGMKEGIEEMNQVISQWKQEEEARISDRSKFLMKIGQNQEQIKRLTALPNLVGHLVEIMEMTEEEELTEKTKVKCATIKSSMGASRSTYFLYKIGLMDPDHLKPGDLLSLNKDTYCVLKTLPPEHDPRIKGMEVTEKPTDTFEDIGGMKSQIQELIEATIWPITKKDKFTAIGIPPPKGVLLYGPPGTGKTMMARAVAASTNATFLRLGGTQVIQMFIGEGAKLLRDAFQIARDKAPTILFIDEIDSIGKKRTDIDTDSVGSREVQRTLIELLNQLDGLEPLQDVKVLAATNRVDVLDPALIRSGRLDRKIEVPGPTVDGRAEIMRLHSRKIKTKGVNFEELARCTEDFNGAQCKAVCVEAAMIALRRNSAFVTHEDFMDGVLEIQEKKKCKFSYYI